MGTMAVIGMVSVFREKGPLMGMARQYSTMTMITTAMATLQTIAFDTSNTMLIVTDILTVIIFYYIGKCIERIEKYGDLEI